MGLKYQISALLYNVLQKPRRVIPFCYSAIIRYCTTWICNTWVQYHPWCRYNLRVNITQWMLLIFLPVQRGRDFQGNCVEACCLSTTTRLIPTICSSMEGRRVVLLTSKSRCRYWHPWVAIVWVVELKMVVVILVWHQTWSFNNARWWLGSLHIHTSWKQL